MLPLSKQSRQRIECSQKPNKTASGRPRCAFLCYKRRRLHFWMNATNVIALQVDAGRFWVLAIVFSLSSDSHNCTISVTAGLQLCSGQQHSRKCASVRLHNQKGAFKIWWMACGELTRHCCRLRWHTMHCWCEACRLGFLERWSGCESCRCQEIQALCSKGEHSAMAYLSECQYLVNIPWYS